MEWINCFKDPPPDGEWILVWYKTCSGYLSGEAFYSPGDDFPWHIPCDEWDDDTTWAKKHPTGGMMLSIYAVKYWMPLPDGPDDDVN